MNTQYLWFIIPTIVILILFIAIRSAPSRPMWRAPDEERYDDER